MNHQITEGSQKHNNKKTRVTAEVIGNNYRSHASLHLFRELPNHNKVPQNMLHQHVTMHL